MENKVNCKVLTSDDKIVFNKTSLAITFYDDGTEQFEIEIVSKDALTNTERILRLIIFFNKCIHVIIDKCFLN